MENRSNYLITKAYRNYLFASVLTMLASQLATTTDGIVVSRYVGATALAGINAAQPLLTAVSAITVLFSYGAVTRLAQQFGAHDDDGVKETFTITTQVLAVIGAALSLGICIFAGRISHLLSTNKEIAGYAARYMRVWALGVVPMQLGSLFQSFVEVDGKPMLVSLTVIITSFLNLVLDFVFVRFLGWSIEGCAAATALVYLMAALSMIFFGLLRSKSFRPKYNRSRGTLRNCMREGLPMMLANVLLAVVVYMINHIVTRTFGVAGMACWSICTYIFMFALVVINGFSNTVFSVGGYLIGERDMHGVRMLRKRVMMSVIVLTLICMAIVIIRPQLIARLFHATPEMKEAGLYNTLRVFSLMLVPFAIVMIRQSFFQILGYRVAAISMTGGMMVLLVIGSELLSRYAPQLLWWMFPAAGVVAALAQSLVMYLIHRHKPGTSPFTLLPDKNPGVSMSRSVAYTRVGQISLLKDVAAFLEKHAPDARAASTLNLIVEEISGNIFRYAAREKTKRFYDVHVIVDEGELIATFKDDGKPFDPTVTPEGGDVTHGIGLRIVNRMKADVQYKHMYGENIVFVSVPLNK